MPRLPPLVRRTPGISCEAVPASMPLTGAGIRRHLRLSAACGARVGAAESFVSFIPLFDSKATLAKVGLASVPVPSAGPGPFSRLTYYARRATTRLRVRPLLIPPARPLAPRTIGRAQPDV